MQKIEGNENKNIPSRGGGGGGGGAGFNPGSINSFITICDFMKKNTTMTTTMTTKKLDLISNEVGRLPDVSYPRTVHTQTIRTNTDDLYPDNLDVLNFRSYQIILFQTVRCSC